MITIADKKDCCGCSACSQKCPTKSITMRSDCEGFLYPSIETATCVNCGLCEKVCPIKQPKHSHEPINVFAAKNPDERVRLESSSGGVFSILAENIIHEGGVVFGARWNDDWNVEHSYTETIEGLKAFRGSKYVQSNVNGCYLKAEKFLKEGRKVLFSGTPCQVAGLKTFLRKEYDNLQTVEIACHGVPSPGLWQEYLAEVSKGKSIVRISHRDKRTGWRNYSVVIKFTNGQEISQAHDDNPWVRAFIKNLDLRPSCHMCAFKLNHSLADITLGDLWGASKLVPGQNDDKGITVGISHTMIGDNALSTVDLIKDIPIQGAIRYNGALLSSPMPNKERTGFFCAIANGKLFNSTVKYLTRDPFKLRLKILISKLFRH